MSCKYNNCKHCGYKSECEIYKENADLELKIKKLTQHLEPQAMTALFEQVEEEVKQGQKIKELEKESNHLFLEGAKRVEELEEKNAKLKEEIKYLSEQIQKLKIELDTPESVVLDKLDEAKEIIRNLLRVTYGEGWNYSLDWKVKAEQFLKEAVVDS